MDCGGDTAYVFIAMIVLSDENGILKHTADSLARVICKDVESVKRAVTHLESEDPDSNLKAHKGRRIVPLHELNEDETRGWFVVNKDHYRDQKDLDEIRAQTRERVRRFRERNAEKRDVTPGNAELRHTDTDTDTDTKKEQRQQRSRGSRLPTAWKPSKDLEAWAAKERPDLEPRITLDRFRDYWAALPGSKAVKLDWDATFRNWVRAERAGSKPKEIDFEALTKRLEEQERASASL